MLHQTIFRLHAHDFANVDKKQSDAAILDDFGFADLLGWRFVVHHEAESVYLSTRLAK